LKRGPWTTKDIKRVLEKDGWAIARKGSHQTVWKHPTKHGSYPVSEHWTGLRAKDPILRGLCRTCCIDEKHLLRLLNGIDD
jgi:predicted RNA binding protein YcfA (HicA-like mRNA interferase family)